MPKAAHSYKIKVSGAMLIDECRLSASLISEAVESHMDMPQIYDALPV